MTFQALNSGTTQPTADLDHLINLLAFQVRSGRSEYGLTRAQNQVILERFHKIVAAYPEIHVRVMEACNEDRRFWQQPADTQLKYLDRAGLLVDTLGV
jgi:hypothetical protein